MSRLRGVVPVAVLTAGLLAGCGDDEATTPANPVPATVAPSPAPTTEPPVSSGPASPSVSAAPSSTGATAAAAACRALGAAMQAGTIADPGVVDAIVADAGRSSDVFLKAAAGRLSAAHRLMLKEKGKPTEPARIKTLRTRGTDMLRSCRTRGQAID